jgi:hypothetical protein
MLNDRNRNSVLRQLAALQKMSLADLKEKWHDLYGSEPPNFSRAFLQKRLAYRIQELFYGGLKKETKAKLTGSQSGNSITKQKNPFALGTRFIRIWNQQEHEVVVISDGFEYQGQKFNSLTAVAKKITGSHWNGRKFFGLPRSNREPKTIKPKE